MKFWVLVLCVGVVSETRAGSSCCRHGSLVLDDQFCTDGNDTKTPLSLTCSETALIVDSEELGLDVDDSGKLRLLLPNREVTYDAGKFCDGLKDIRTKDNQVVRKHVALICNPKVARLLEEDVYGYCMLISTVFLLVTCTVYAMKPGHRDLQGKSIMNLCVSLGLGLSILVIMKLVPYSDMNLCAARGFLAYFFILVTFFWMNSISIQILWGLKQPQGTHLESKPDIWHVLYAWGVPAVLTIFMAVINFMPGDHLKPGIGLNHCWFFNVQQQWHYMYSVISVLILVNVIIFATATVSICCYGYTNQKKCFKQKFATCLQLLVVMGIPWIFEMIGSLAPPHMAWEIIDLFNSLQGVWIFLVLVILPPKEKEEDTSQYNINITVEQPYSKISKY